MTGHADPPATRPLGCGHTAAEHQDHVRDLFAARDPLGALMKRGAIRIGSVDEDDRAAEPRRLPAATARTDHTCRAAAAAAPAIPA
jgi:hypothetical protein